jgi:hypothetical protein
MGNELFPSGMDNIIDKHSTPRKLRVNERLVVGKRYYFPDMKQKLKCINIDKIDGFIFYYLANDSFQHVFSHPLGYEAYILIPDKDNLLNKNIVNDENVYKGYQIKWWFYKHNYKRYKNFINQLNTLNDNNMYVVSGILKHKVYVNCNFDLVRKGEYI